MKCHNCESSDGVTVLNPPDRIRYYTEDANAGFFARRKYRKHVDNLNESANLDFCNKLVRKGFDLNKWAQKSTDGDFWLCKKCKQKVRNAIK